MKQINFDHITPAEVVALVKAGEKIELSAEARTAIQKCRDYLDHKAAESPAPIYGVTTGFGSLCNISVDADQLATLQRNLVMSHSCGTGDKVSREVVKVMMVLKVQSLSYGHSGVQVATVERLIEMYNRDIVPVVYQQGSLGASGDLSPLAHLSLPLLGLGEVEYKGKVVSGAEMLAEEGWEPIALQSKEGLALLNGTQFMSAHAVWAIEEAVRLSRTADLLTALSLDAFDGRLEPFSDNVHLVRPHKGQLTTARAIRALLEGSEIAAQPKQHVQDPYSFRCVPQVHGAVKDTIEYVQSVIDTEINSTTDNPTVFPDTDEVISAGNFTSNSTGAEELTSTTKPRATC